MKAVLLLTVLFAVTAQAKDSKFKTAPGIYTTQAPQEIDAQTALSHALKGEKVYKCQEVELRIGKGSASLKPVRVEKGE